MRRQKPLNAVRPKGTPAEIYACQTLREQVFNPAAKRLRFQAWIEGHLVTMWCPSANLIIEVGKTQDRKRDLMLSHKHGIKTLWFTEEDVYDTRYIQICSNLIK